MNGSQSWKRRGLATELFTDLYELRMLRAYWELGMNRTGVFSLFARKLPPARNLLIACGIDSVLDEVADLGFDRASLDYLATLDGFPEDFLRWLEGLSFSGDIHAVAEGTPVFANEPILEVVAPIAEAQLLETLIMNRVTLATVMASKAWRVVAAANGRPVVDFGGRRAHGLDAAIEGARAFHIAGVAATSNCLAGQIYDIPVSGTMAHSFIEACDSERAAMESFARIFPGTVLLVDTYDTLTGVRRVCELAAELGEAFRISAVRLDSGDLGALACEARAMLDAAGLSGVQIFASGGLSEEAIAELLGEGAPVDGFGVGTDMSVSRDAPGLDIAYKLTEYAGEGRLKLSSGKRTLPGRKQLFRRIEDGRATGDVIARADESLDGEALLAPAMRGGRRVAAPRALSEIRADTLAAIRRLPAAVQGIEPDVPPYPVEISRPLEHDEAEVRAAIRARAGE